MIMQKLFIAFFLSLTSLFVIGSRASGASEDLIAAANKEGNLVLYGGGALPDITKLVANFNRAYPGIKVDYLRKSATSLFGLITGELRAKTYKADVYSPLHVDQAIHLTERSLLSRYASPERAYIPEHLKDRDGYWTTLYRAGHVYAYNTRLVGPRDVPRSYQDFLEPKWKGRILMDAGEELWYALVLEILGKEKGMLFMQALARQNPQFQESKTLMMQLLCAGEVALAFPVNFNQANEAIKKGCPTAWVAIEPQTQQPPFTIVMAPNAPHPSAAKVFINFMLSKDGQKFMQENIFRQSSRIDVEPSGDLAKLKDIRVWKSDWNVFFRNRDQYREGYKQTFSLP